MCSARGNGSVLMDRATLLRNQRRASARITSACWMLRGMASRGRYLLALLCRQWMVYGSAGATTSTELWLDRALLSATAVAAALMRQAAAHSADSSGARREALYSRSSQRRARRASWC